MKISMRKHICRDIICVGKITLILDIYLSNEWGVGSMTAVLSEYLCVHIDEKPYKIGVAYFHKSNRTPVIMMKVQLGETGFSHSSSQVRCFTKYYR